MPSAVIPELQQTTFGNSSFQWVGVLGGAKGALAIAYTPVVGSLSDERGRYFATLAILSLSALPYLVQLATDNFLAYSIANAFAGLYNLALTMIILLISDRVPQIRKGRTIALSLNLAVFLVGVGASSFIGAALATPPAFSISLGCQLAATAAAAYFLRYANHANDAFAQERAEATALLAAPTSAVRVPASAPASPLSLPHHFLRAWRLFCSNRNLVCLSAIVFWNYLTQDMFEQMLLLYLQNTLNFTDNDQTYAIGVMSLASVLFVILVVAWRDHLSDASMLRVALIANCAMSILYCFATRKWQAIALPAFNVLGMAALPCVSSMTVDAVGPAEVGAAQGLIAAARVAAGTVCPLAYGWLFNATQSSNMPGSPFLVGAACVFLSFLISFGIKLESPPGAAASALDLA